MCQIIRIKQLLSFEFSLQLTVRLHTGSQLVGGTTWVSGCRVYLVFKGPGVINAMVRHLEGQRNKEGPKKFIVGFVMCPSLPTTMTQQNETNTAWASFSSKRFDYFPAHIIKLYLHYICISAIQMRHTACRN